MRLGLGLSLALRLSCAAAYDPNSEAGSDRVWFDTQDVASYTVAATRVTQFTNKATGVSYTGNNASAYAGGATVKGFNGFPGCTPSGSDNYSAAEAVVYQYFLTQANNPYTAYAVYVPTSATADYILFSVANHAATNSYKGWGQAAAGQLTVTANDGTSRTVNSASAALVAGKPVCMAVTYDGTTVRFYQDGALIGTQAQSVAAQASANFCALFFRGRSANDLDLNGEFGELRIRDACHDAAAVARMSTYLRTTKWQLDYPSVTFVGDSLVNRSPLGPGDPSEVLSAWIKPQLIKGSATQTWGLGVNGTTIAAGMNGATQLAWRNFHGRAWHANTWAYIAGGTNDLCLTPGRTAAQVITDTTGWVTSARAAGFTKVVVETLHERTVGQLCFNGSDFETERNTINAAYLAGDTGADFITDGGAALKTQRLAMGLAPGVANALYTDAVHLTALGYSYKYAPLVALLNANL